MKQPHPLKPKIGVAAVSSPLEVGADRAPTAARELTQLLDKAGCEVVELGHIGTADAATHAGRRLAEAHVHAVALAATSWYEDYLVTDLLEECNLPVLFWPLPGMETGALCGTQQTTAALHALGYSYESVFGTLADTGCLRRAIAFLRGAALHHRLRRARIGLAGHHVNGMTHTVANELLFKKTLGPRVVHLDLPQLLARAEKMPGAEAQWEALRQQAGSCNAVDADGLDSVRIFLALREVVREHGLHALGIGCYPHLMGRVCLPATLLADEGVPMACEGDPHGALAQYALQLLTDEPTHNTDFLDPLDETSVVFSHCGAGSWSLAERPAEVKLTPVRLMSRGVCSLFTARPGPVTLLNITPGLDHYKVAVLEGESVSTTMVFPGNPTQVRFDMPVSQLIDWIQTTGLGHHWMIGYGRVGAELRAWARLAGVRLTEPFGFAIK